MDQLYQSERQYILLPISNEQKQDITKGKNEKNQ